MKDNHSIKAIFPILEADFSHVCLLEHTIISVKPVQFRLGYHVGQVTILPFLARLHNISHVPV